MHVISQKRIVDAKEKYPEAKTAFDGWYRLISANEFKSFSEIKSCFRSVDKVGDFYVFNIGGNKYRLIAVIHFNRNKIYIREVLTHDEYDQNKWKRSH